jgi:NADP-dependent 3-hydroxy acid dehydrogenase YdfG
LALHHARIDHGNPDKDFADAFNNAGVAEAIGTTADLKEEEWNRIIGINLRGIFLSKIKV